MLGSMVKGIGSGIGSAVKGISGVVAETAGLSDFTSALGGEKKSAKPKAVKPKAFDEDESPTKILQRILTEVQTIHKVMASQIVPPSEEEEIQRDKDKKDEEVLEALEDLRPEEEKKEKKKPWWKRLLLMIAPFFLWILNPLNWLKFLPTIPGFAKFALFAKVLGRFFLFTPIGRAIAIVALMATNWQSIRKTISNSIISIRNTIKEILEFIPLVNPPKDWDEGTEEVRLWGRTKEEREVEEAAEKEDIIADTEEGKDWWIDEDGKMNIMITGGPADAGNFAIGGMIPKNKVGLVGEAGLESVDGTMISTPTMVEGPARVRREWQNPNVEAHGYEHTPKEKKNIAPKIVDRVMNRVLSNSPLKVLSSIANMAVIAEKHGLLPEGFVKVGSHYTKTGRGEDADVGRDRPGAGESYLRGGKVIPYRPVDDTGDGWQDPNKKDGWQDPNKTWQDPNKGGMLFAGNFQVGGMIPKGKVGLAGEAGPESVLGNMLGGPSLVEGPARVRREKPESSPGMALSMANLSAPWGGPTTPKGFGGKINLKPRFEPTPKPGPESMSLAMANLSAPWGGPTMPPGGGPTIPKGFSGMMSAFDPMKTAPKGIGGGPKKPGESMSEVMLRLANASAPHGGPRKPGESMSEVMLRLANASAPHGGPTMPPGGGPTIPKGFSGMMSMMLAMSKPPKGIGKRVVKTIGRSLRAVIIGGGLGYDLKSVIAPLEKDDWSGYGPEGSSGTAAKAVAEFAGNQMPAIFYAMQNLNESTLQQAGQQSTVTVVTHSSSTNVSTASSQSKQNNVGQTQQSIPTSNIHGAAPRTV